MDSLLQRLNDRSSPLDAYNSSSGSIPITPATEEFASTPGTDVHPSLLVVDASELEKLKLELRDARNEVNRMNQEIHSQHVARSTMEHLSQSSEADYSYTGDVTEQTLTQLQNKFNASTRTASGWGNEPARPSYAGSNSFAPSYQLQTQARPSLAQPGYQRNSFLNEPAHFPLDQSFRSSGMTNGMSNSFSGMTHAVSNPPSRPGSAFDPLYSQYTMPQMYPVGHSAPVGVPGSRLSPDACEFSATTNGMGPSPWNTQVSGYGPSISYFTDCQLDIWRDRLIAVHGACGAHELSPSARP